MKTTQKKLYWICQIGGWTFYSLTDMVSYFTIFRFDYEKFGGLMAEVLVNTLVGIFLTHWFRLIFKRFQWIKLPIANLVLQCLGAVFIITLILDSFNVPMDRALLDIDNNSGFFGSISYFVNLSKPVIFWMLIYVMYSYTNERKNDEIEKIRLKSSIRETESKVLRAQMNPHFMFNALNSIRALVLEDPARAQEGITQLSNILRSSLVADRRKTVSLREELKTIEDYLGLEKVRYEERLQIKWDTDPDTLSLQVPPMMLQTLVENAIKHGVQKALRWGFVEINTSLINNQLHIKIRNTGELKATESKSEVGGFGLKNTSQRLNLLYGSDAHFNIYQEDNQIVCAEIVLPVQSTTPNP